MAKVHEKRDDQDFPPVVGPGFTANNPMPPQHVVDAMAAQVKQIEPEELLMRAHDPLAVAPYDPLAVAIRGNYTGKDMNQIVQEFLAAVSAHPDGKMLNSRVGGTPNDQQRFGDTELKSQHLVELRLVYRDVSPVAELAAMSGGAPAKKPWKYQALIDELGKEQLSGRAAEIIAKKNRELVPA